MARVAYVRVCGRDSVRFSSALPWAVLSLLAAPALNSVALELKNVLAVHGVLSNPRPYLAYGAFTCLSVLVSAAVLVWRARRGRGTSGRRELVVRSGYVLLLLAVLFCAYRPGVMVEYGSEYFGSANHGLALDALFRYGELPPGGELRCPHALQAAHGLSLLPPQPL